MSLIFMKQKSLHIQVIIMKQSYKEILIINEEVSLDL